MRLHTKLTDEMFDDIAVHNTDDCVIEVVRYSNPNGGLHAITTECVSCMEVLIEIENTELA